MLCAISYIHHMIKQLLTCLLCIMPFIAFTQLGSTSILGAKSLSMGGSGTASSGIQSIYFGQAGLTSIEKFSFQLSSEQRYSLPELSAISAAAAFRAGKIGVFGIFVSNYGIDEYKDQKVAASYARKVSDGISIGAQFGMNTLRIQDYGMTQYISLDIGILADLSESITLGIHASNPTSSSIASEETIQRLINIGIEYKISERAQILTDFRRRFSDGNSLHAGVHYQIVDALAIRMGIESNPGSVSFGLLVNMGSKFKIEGGFNSHQFLGTTPGLSIGYED